MNWIYEKFIGDGAIYAICQVCGFVHNASSYNIETKQVSIDKTFPYCPICGERGFNSNNDVVDVIYNEREMPLNLDRR